MTPPWQTAGAVVNPARKVIMFTFASKASHSYMPEQLRGIEKPPVALYFQNIKATILKLKYPCSILIKQSLVHPVQLPWLLTKRCGFEADLQIKVICKLFSLLFINQLT